MIALAMVLALLAAPALAHDPYTGWMRPDGGGSCCNRTDCRRVEWRPGPAGIEIEIDGHWIVPPPAAMLSQPSNDGTAHACWTRGRPPHCVQQPGGAS